MENNLPQKQPIELIKKKKKWQKPNFYILDTNTINSGSTNNFYEVQNGNHNKLFKVGYPGLVYNATNGQYSVAHS